MGDEGVWREWKEWREGELGLDVKNKLIFKKLKIYSSEVGKIIVLCLGMNT